MINITVLHYRSNQRRRLRPTRLVTIALLYVQHDMVSVDILKVFVFLIAPIYVVIHETNGHTEPRRIYVDPHSERAIATVEMRSSDHNVSEIALRANEITNDVRRKREAKFRSLSLFHKYEKYNSKGIDKI